MVIISFGAGFDLESTNVTYIASMAAIVAYGKKKGVELGGYDDMIMTMIMTLTLAMTMTLRLSA